MYVVLISIHGIVFHYYIPRYFNVFQVVRSQTSTPEGSPVNGPRKDPSKDSMNPGENVADTKPPAAMATGGGFMSWVPGMRSSGPKASADTVPIDGGNKSATEELVRVAGLQCNSNCTTQRSIR